MTSIIQVILLLALHAALHHAATPPPHPSLYFSAADLPYLQSKAQRPFFAAVLKQYEDALNGDLLYSAGGVLENIDECSGCGWRHQLAATLYVAGGRNASYWGQVAKKVMYAEIMALTPATGNWFAGSERNLEQLIGTYDVLVSLFSPQEIADVEQQFALNAQYMYAAPPRAHDTAHISLQFTRLRLTTPHCLCALVLRVYLYVRSTNRNGVSQSDWCNVPADRRVIPKKL